MIFSAAPARTPSDTPARTSGIQINLATGRVAADGDGAADNALGIEVVLGSLHADTITGSAATNVLLGGEGDDLISGRGRGDYLAGQGGNDTLDGGRGATDVVDYLLDASAVDADLGIARHAAVTTAVGGEADSLIGLESVAGTEGADRLIGSPVANGRLW